MSEDLGFLLFYAGLLLIPCAVQLLLCFLVKKKALKCIPVYLVAVCLVLCVLVILGAFGDIPLGDIEIHGAVGFVLLIFVGIAAAGVALAWGVYGITLAVRHKASLQNA